MIIAVGDVHGKFNTLTSKVEEILQGNTGVHFVQVGDFGLGFEKPVVEWNTLYELNIILKNGDSKMYVIRGNHDNPAFWLRGCSFEFSNIKFVQDQSSLLIEDKLCYFVGGAISVDRTRRRQGIDYWSGEETNEGFRGLIEIWDKIDILFTHDVYHHCSPYTISGSDIVNHFARVDENLIGDLERSQSVMRTLYEDILKTNPTFVWYHGHYHESHVTNNDGQLTHSISELEFKEVR
jgi:hypothetical protein